MFLKSVSGHRHYPRQKLERMGGSISIINPGAPIYELFGRSI